MRKTFPLTAHYFCVKKHKKWLDLEDLRRPLPGGGPSGLLLPPCLSPPPAGMRRVRRQRPLT
jgi:hypothetical protein